MDSLDKVLADIGDWLKDNECSYFNFVTVDAYATIKLHEDKLTLKHMESCWWAMGREDGLKNRNLVKRLLEVCDDDWTKCCYELPRSKPKYHRQVLDVFVSEHADDCVILDCRDSKEAKKIQRQLEAQFKIIDIIQRTQNELDPTWVADWWNVRQKKCYPYLSHIDKEVKFHFAYTDQAFHGAMYCSDKVAVYLQKHKLITAELLKQWQTGE